MELLCCWSQNTCGNVHFQISRHRGWNDYQNVTQAGHKFQILGPLGVEALGWCVVSNVTEVNLNIQIRGQWEQGLKAAVSIKMFSKPPSKSESGVARSGCQRIE
jgi:hypothetical protein